jgi:hypothetical protein
MLDQLLAQVAPLETQVRVLNRTIMDMSTKLHARSLYLEQATATKDDLQKLNSKLTKKLEGKSDSLSSVRLLSHHANILGMFPADMEAELQTLKVIAENVVAYFYPQDSDTVSRAPELLDVLPTRSWEIIISNMSKVSNLTLRILKSLYPKVDLGAAGEGFAATCSEDEATDLVQSFLETVIEILEMILIDMSYVHCKFPCSWHPCKQLRVFMNYCFHKSFSHILL